MNKNAIKKFAIEARKKLIASVSDRAGMLGITPEGCSEPISKGIDFEVYKTVAGTEVTLGRTQCEQRRKLKEQIDARGFDAVVEEVAYTWFNRICAIRFMEVNDYLPTRVRVLSSEKEGKNEPDIVTQAPDVDLDFTDKEREYILDCKMNNKLDELFKMLFIKQCNKLSEILPGLFEATEDYTEMLLNISYTNKDDVISMLVNPDTGIPEADFNVSSIGEDGQPTGQVEIIGWLYQYYNTELKDDTFAQLKKNIKISKERIPAATQLFTPDWIVRYMVENSVGRLWIEHLRAVDPAVNEKEVAERFGWKYYLPEAEQEANANVKLAEIRTSYKDLKPEDITCIDPCMGSGHILVAMFDVLMDIYKSAGYSERDAAFEIVEHNIHGLDIDKRAYQLAYFAVMMKGRGYNRRFFVGKDGVKVTPNIYAIEESNLIVAKHIELMGNGIQDANRSRIKTDLVTFLGNMRNAKEIGSLLILNEYNWGELREFVCDMKIQGQISFEYMGAETTQAKILRLLAIGEVLCKKYAAVVTNPPYMGSSGMNNYLSDYVKVNYIDSKEDLYSAFIKKSHLMIAKTGYIAMITMHSWMFLSSFEKLREYLLQYNFINLVHLGSRAFDNDVGTIVQTAAFVISKRHLDMYAASYLDLNVYSSPEEKRKGFEECSYVYRTVSDRFVKIPNKPIAYWISEPLLDAFDVGESIEKYVDTFQGIITGDNKKFLKYWYEVDLNSVALHRETMQEVDLTKTYWIPYNKGGSTRKWYGIQDYVIDWRNGPDDKTRGRKTFESFYLREYASWSYTVTDCISMRYYPYGFLWDVRGSGLMPKDDKLFYLMGLISSKVGLALFKINNSTLSCQVENILQMPIIISESYFEEITKLVKENIEISKIDWDTDEISWDFKSNPLVRNVRSLKEAYETWEKECEERFRRVKENEARINELFIRIYGLEGQLNSCVEDKDIYIKRASMERDVRDFLSYFVGCVFGRYSIDEPGVINASQSSIRLDEYDYVCTENLVPVTEDEYFEADIVCRLEYFLSTLYGSKCIEENLKFIASGLGYNNIAPRVAIRKYFLNDFFADHCKKYQKTPIYWCFDSGKQKTIRTISYYHRYSQELIAKLRVDIIHKAQDYVENAFRRAEYVLANSISASEKSRATNSLSKYTKELEELKVYDEAVAHIANARVTMETDKGVAENYRKFQSVLLSREGIAGIKIDLLAQIK